MCSCPACYCMGHFLQPGRKTMILCGNCHVSFSVVPQPCYLTTNQWTSKPLYLEYTESTALMSLPRITSCWCYNMLWKVLMLSILLQNSSIFLHPGLKSTCWSERPLVSVHTKAAKEVLTPPGWSASWLGEGSACLYVLSDTYIRCCKILTSCYI